MNIKVEDNNSFYILEDGAWFCQHLHTDTESIDYGYPDRYIGDYVDNWQDRTVCQECGEVLDD